MAFCSYLLIFWFTQISPIRHSPTAHSPMAKVHCTFASTRLGLLPIGDSPLYLRQYTRGFSPLANVQLAKVLLVKVLGVYWRMRGWRKSYWRNSSKPVMSRGKSGSWWILGSIRIQDRLFPRWVMCNLLS